MKTIEQLPRRAVLGYLELARLPLTAAERALGKREGTWPVTIAADRVQAVVKEMAGTVLGDETLKADARMQRAALDERLRAASLHEQAEEVRARTERAEEEAERAVERKAARKKQAVRKAAAAREEVIDRRERAATKATIAKESKAVREQRAAAEAKAESLELEDELETARAARQRRA